MASNLRFLDGGEKKIFLRPIEENKWEFVGEKYSLRSGMKQSFIP